MKENAAIAAARRLHELGRHRECVDALGLAGTVPAGTPVGALDLAASAFHRLGRLEDASRLHELAADAAPSGEVVSRLFQAAQALARLGGGGPLSRLRERVESQLPRSTDGRDRSHYLGILSLEHTAHGRGAEALETLAEARRQLAASAGDPLLEAWIALREAYVLRRQGRADDAVHRCREVLELLADHPGEPLVAAAQRVIATVHLTRLEPLEALQPLARSLHLFRGAGDRLGEADALRTTGVVQRRLGRIEESSQLLEAARAVYHELGLVSRESRAHSEIGHTLLAAGEVTGALAAYRRDLALLESLQDEERWLRARAQVARRLGRAELLAAGLLPVPLGEARGPGRASGPAARRGNRPDPEEAADGSMRLDALVSAEKWLESSRQLSQRGGDPVSVARAWLELGWTHWIRGDRHRVEACLARAAEGMDARALPPAHDAISARLEARLALPDEPERARERLEATLRRLAGPVPSLLALEVRLDLGDLEELSSRVDAAVDHHRHAYEDARALSASAHCARILERLVRISPGELIASTLDARASLSGEGTEPEVPGLVGRSEAMDEVRRRILRAANREIPVLLLGETGVGKGVVARAIHQLSARSRGPLHALNMAAISESLADSELFGHREGSFTGATASRRGAFRVASGGTLFLDEIGDLSPACQAKLLHALDEGRIQPVGEDLPVPVDVRLIFATHQDLDGMVEERTFRRDLLERIRRYVIHVPPLRDRPGDIEDLVAEFELRHGKLDLDGAAMECLKSHDWPGNVRQLLNVLQSALVDREPARPVRREDLEVLLGPGRRSRPSSAPATAPGPPPAGTGSPLRALIRECAAGDHSVTVMEELERRVFDTALEMADGNVSEAARLLGVHRNTLMRHRKRAISMMRS